MAVIWVGFIVILFMLPPAVPITVNTFNYAPIAVLAVLVFSTVTWFAGGRVHFMRDVPKGTTRSRPRRSSADMVTDRGGRDLALTALPDAVLRPASGNAFENTVEQLARAIRLGVLADGEQLPPERDLAARLGVSRNTLREAIAALRDSGLVTTRRGRGGGTTVTYAAETPASSRGVTGTFVRSGAAMLDALDLPSRRRAGRGVVGSEPAAGRRPAGLAHGMPARGRGRLRRRRGTGSPTPGCTSRSRRSRARRCLSTP